MKLWKPHSRERAFYNYFKFMIENKLLDVGVLCDLVPKYRQYAFIKALRKEDYQSIMGEK